MFPGPPGCVVGGWGLKEAATGVIMERQHARVVSSVVSSVVRSVKINDDRYTLRGGGCEVARSFPVIRFTIRNPPLSLI